MTVYKNKYAGTCNNITCKSEVPVGDGFIQKINNRWVTWCPKCVPEKIKAAPAQRREFTIENGEGRVYTPYEENNLPLIRSMPGARWNKAGKFWNVSADEADRIRILEIAEKLNLQFDDSLRVALSEEAQNALDSRLYDFQVDGVNWLSRRDDALLGDDMGLGKSQPLFSKILTPTGWKLMGDIKTNNLIVGCDGKSYRVTGVYPQGKLPIFKITFSDGFSTFSSDEHLWAVNTPVRKQRGNPHKVLKLKEIRNSIKNSSGNNQHFIPIVKPIEFEHQETPISAWMMGYLIANGNFTSNTPRVTAPTIESQLKIAENIISGISINPIKNNDIDFYLSGDNKRFETNPLTEILNNLELMGKGFDNKFIPDEYMFNSVKIRCELFQGLMDGDGSVAKKDNHLEYSTGSKRLAENIAFLIQSLGGTARISSRIPTYSHKGEKKHGSLSYRISISLPNDIHPFQLPQKSSVYRERVKYQPSRAIVSIEYAGHEECQCISVDSKDKLYVTDHCIVTHNTVQTLVSLPKDGSAPVLVVCPASLKYNWQDEVEKWRPDYKTLILKNKSEFRFPERGEIIIMNFEQLPDWLEAPDRAKMPWAIYKPVLEKFRAGNRKIFPQAGEVILVVDEAHRLKNYKTKRAMRATELVQMVNRVWGLTGTPFDNKPADLYGVLSTLDMAFKTFGSWKNFCRLMNARRGRFGLEWGKPLAEVPERLRRVMLRRRREVVLPDLPKKTYSKLVVGDMSATLRKQLDKLWEEFGTQVEVAEALPPFELFSKIRAELAKSRIKAMLEYVENAEEQDVPLVVFSAHLAPLDKLLTRKGWAVITGDTKLETRQKIVRKFQNGELKGVGLTIKAGGVGLTLTRAWKALFVDLGWTPAENAQAEDRICRIGQESDVVEIIRMVSDHPMDLHVLNILSEKITLIEAAIEAVLKVNPGTATSSRKDETEEEYQARMKQIEDAAAEFEAKEAERKEAENRERGEKKAPVILEREKERHARTKSAKAVLPLTDARKATVVEAFAYMMSVCDGALTRDNVGFNKPDAMVARFLVWAGMERDVEIEAAYYMLTRYYSQLKNKYPILFESR